MKRVLFCSIVNRMIKADVKNGLLRSCKQCRFYKPDNFYSSEYASPFGLCRKFGFKNIVTDKITLYEADVCRKEDDKCGMDATHFEQEPYVWWKEGTYNFRKRIPYLLLVFIPSTIFLVDCLVNK